MATENSPQDGSRTFKIKRFQIGLNVLVQIVILVMITVMVNYFAFNYFKRWDWSRTQKYALADKTKRVLFGLKKPVNIVVFFSSESDIRKDLENLLKEYQYSSNGKLAIEVVDPARNFSRARDLQAQYKFGANENIVILDCGGRTKFLNAADMAEYDNNGAMYGQSPKLKAFRGEEVITSGLLEVSSDKQNKIYAVKGQGEREITDDAYKGIKIFIERENIKIASLDLQNVDIIPSDAKALVIVGPRYDFSEREMKMLNEFWNKKGRVFLMLDPNASTPRLSAFLRDQGIVADDDRLMRTVAVRQLTGIVTAVLRDVTARFLEGSPITKRLKGINGLFIGATQSLTLDRQPAQASGIRLDPLVQASEGYWGKADYNVGQGDEIIFDPKKDRAQPLIIAASVEKGALNDTRVQVESARMIVAGNCEFIADASLSEANANLDFTLNGIDWLLDREELIGIAPKESKTFSLNLTDDQIGNIVLLTMFAMPGIIALFGLAVWWKRRR